MKYYYQEIHNCSSCPCVEKNKKNNYCNIKDKLLEDLSILPKDCPLPNKPKEWTILSEGEI